MKGYQKIFKRVEQKYMLTRSEYNLLMDSLKDKMEENEYPNSKILNLYFDTDNNDIAIHTIQKNSYREKLRLRSYKVPEGKDMVFFELKRKCDGVVSKRRISMTLDEYNKYSKTGILENPENMQIFKEIDYTIRSKKLYPKSMVAYDRLSFYLKENKDIRITFDFNLRSRDDDLDLSLGDAGKKYFEKDVIIMEVKALGSLPIWFGKMMNEFKYYPTSFSKYGQIYKKKFSEKQIENKNSLVDSTIKNSEIVKNTNLQYSKTLQTA